MKWDFIPKYHYKICWNKIEKQHILLNIWVTFTFEDNSYTFTIMDKR